VKKTRLAYKTEEGKIALLNTAHDECLWSNEWFTGRQESRFNELYVHHTQGGKRIFYLAYITRWQGESNSITVIEDIKDWVTENYSSLTAKEIARLKELGVTVEETA
jgi:hypothetical protein